MRSRDFNFQIIDKKDISLNKDELYPTEDYELVATVGEEGQEIYVSCPMRDFEHNLFPQMLIHMGEALLELRRNKDAV